MKRICKQILRNNLMNSVQFDASIGGGNYGHWLINPLDNITLEESNLWDALKDFETYQNFYYDCYGYPNHQSETQNTDYTGTITSTDGDYPLYQYAQGERYYENIRFVFEVALSDKLSVFYHMKHDDEPFYYHSDHLGSAAWITDKNGLPVQYLMYAPYGEQLLNQQSTTTYNERFTFTGKERDAETGYDYFGARNYLSALSIWGAVDPLADKYIYNSPYVYCDGNPIKFVDPDGNKVVYNDATGDCESMVDEYCSQSAMFKAAYNQLVESDDTYTFQFGETVDNVNGQFIPSEKGGVITLKRNGRWSSAIPEETFHALQKDNKGKYNDTKLNLEFEAKVFVIMSGLPTSSYYGMDEAYYTSLLRMDISEFTQPQSITEYIKQANIYSTENKNNAVGNQNYWTPTSISPYNLISIIGKLK